MTKEEEAIAYFSKLQQEQFNKAVNRAINKKLNNKIRIIPPDYSKQFIKNFNKNKPTKEFVESCKKAGKLFGKVCNEEKEKPMIYREYSTEYNDSIKRIRHNIKISTDNYDLFYTIKTYAESVCGIEDHPARCEDACEERRDPWDEDD